MPTTNRTSHEEQAVHHEPSQGYYQDWDVRHVADWQPDPTYLAPGH